MIRSTLTKFYSDQFHINLVGGRQADFYVNINVFRQITMDWDMAKMLVNMGLAAQWKISCHANQPSYRGSR